MNATVKICKFCGKERRVHFLIRCCDKAVREDRNKIYDLKRSIWDSINEVFKK